MNRIDRIFADRRAERRGALMPFITAGDPDLATTGKLLTALQRAGGSIVEIGIPFSDPIADGPVIQASMTHALEGGLRLDQEFATVAAMRDQLNLGLVAMVSYSIVHRRGVKRFVGDAAAAGFDGLIVPDLPLEEAPAVRAIADRANLKLAMLIAPTTPIDRARRLAAQSTGFVYVVARAGITGEQKTLPPKLPERLAELRQATDLPLAVGFGISTAEHVRQVVAVADAAIVGSALVRRIAEKRRGPPGQIVEAAETFTRNLARGLADAASVEPRG